MASNKLVVYGGAGALGRVLVQHFKAKGYVSHRDPFFLVTYFL
jgi:NADPH:quinone reductase-like Zn-dependent oxidoreductase